MNALDTPSSFDDVLFDSGGDSDVSPLECASPPPLRTYCPRRNLMFQPGETVPPPPPLPRSKSLPASITRTRSRNLSMYKYRHRSRIDFSRAVEVLSEADVREAFMEFSEKYCCFSKDSIENMKITHLTTYPALHYVLETFCESRSFDWKEEPYYGGEIDGANKGHPPLPWDVICVPAKQFKTRDYRVTVPHTARVQACDVCRGSFLMTCTRCEGEGKIECICCIGLGTRGAGDTYRACHSCCGSGWKSCTQCEDGKDTCIYCEGCGDVISSIELTARFKNYKKDYILTDCEFPEELIKAVKGEEIFQQTLPQVLPIVAPSVALIGKISAKLIQSERLAHPKERQINQTDLASRAGDYSPLPTQREAFQILCIREGEESLRSRLSAAMLLGLHNTVNI